MIETNLASFRTENLTWHRFLQGLDCRLPEINDSPPKMFLFDRPPVFDEGFYHPNPAGFHSAGFWLARQAYFLAGLTSDSGEETDLATGELTTESLKMAAAALGEAGKRSRFGFEKGLLVIRAAEELTLVGAVPLREGRDLYDNPSMCGLMANLGHQANVLVGREWHVACGEWVPLGLPRCLSRVQTLVTVGSEADFGRFGLSLAANGSGRG